MKFHWIYSSVIFLLFDSSLEPRIGFTDITPGFSTPQEFQLKCVKPRTRVKCSVGNTLKDLTTCILHMENCSNFIIFIGTYFFMVSFRLLLQWLEVWSSQIHHQFFRPLIISSSGWNNSNSYPNYFSEIKLTS